MALKRKALSLKIALLGIFWLLAGCGAPTTYGFDGTPTNWPSYELWLADSQAKDAEQTQWAFYGTPTYTPTATATSTPTPIMSPTPTATATPTATPTELPYLLVDNKNGDRIKTAEFQPDCGGEWGYPGVEIWHVNQATGKPDVLICSTPWNRPMNVAVKVAIGLVLFVVAFAVLLMAWNAIEEGLKKKRQQKQRGSVQARQLEFAPVETAAPARQPTTKDVIKVIRGVKPAVAEAMQQFVSSHRGELQGTDWSAFLEVVSRCDVPLFFDITNAIHLANQTQGE